MSFVETFLNVPVLKESVPFLIKGLWMTVQLGGVSLVLSFVLGLALALVRVYSPTYLKMAVVAYIDFMRATPLLVLLILIYYALPYLGIRLSAFAAATLALSMVSSAYAAEVFRSGIEAVPKGQIEAAHSIGLTWFSTMRDVVIPQAFKLITPAATGIAVSLIKDTALASVVAMPDLLKQATQAQAYFANPSPLIGAAILYVVILLPLVRCVSYMEKKRLAR